MGTEDTPTDWGRSYRKDQVSANSFMLRHPVKSSSKPCVYHIELYSAKAGRKPVAEVCQSREGVLQCLKPTTLPLNMKINLLLTRKGKGPFCYSWIIPWRQEERG